MTLQEAIQKIKDMKIDNSRKSYLYGADVILDVILGILDEIDVPDPNSKFKTEPPLVVDEFFDYTNNIHRIQSVSINKTTNNTCKECLSRTIMGKCYDCNKEFGGMLKVDGDVGC